MGSENVEAGRIVGKHTVELLGDKGKVVIIEGFAGHNPNQERLDGFHEIIDKYPGIEVVASQPADWDRAKGMNVMENIIQAHPEFDLVFACSDEMAIGAMKALEAAGKKLPILSVDGNKEALIEIKKGRITSTVAQRPDIIGEQLITRVAKAIMEGKMDTIPAKIPTPLTNVSKENLSDFLKE